jgi:hypothetical protein
MIKERLIEGDKIASVFARGLLSDGHNLFDVRSP